MEQQQHGFSDSTPRAVGTDYKDHQKVCLVHYKKCTLVKLAPKSMGQVTSTLFKSQEKFVQYEDV